LEKYDGFGKPKEHVDRYMVQWILLPPEKCPHHFIHILNGIQNYCYREHEQCKETANWEEMQHNFLITFSFEHEIPEIETTPKVVRDRIFEEKNFEIIPTYQNHTRNTVRNLLHCYHVIEEDDPTKENACNI
jgi:hypothetical protein